jgi:hypothetical protein
MPEVLVFTLCKQGPPVYKKLVAYVTTHGELVFNPFKANLVAT